MAKCVYCVDGAKKSGEHVISKGAYKVVFRDPIRNRASSPLFKKGDQHNFEQPINDVCRDCNSLLSKYDVAGIEFVNAIQNLTSIKGAILPFNKLILGWLVKTHCNIARVNKIEIDREILKSIIQYEHIPRMKFALLLRGTIVTNDEHVMVAEGTFAQWYQQYDKDASQRVGISALNLKMLDTFMMLPTDINYDDFPSRANAFAAKLFQKSGVPSFDIDKAISEGELHF